MKESDKMRQEARDLLAEAARMVTSLGPADMDAAAILAERAGRILRRMHREATRGAKTGAMSAGGMVDTIHTLLDTDEVETVTTTSGDGLFVRMADGSEFDIQVTRFK